MYKSLLALGQVTNQLCQQIALGTAFDVEICKWLTSYIASYSCVYNHTFLTANHSAINKAQRIRQDPLVFGLWSHDQRELNEEQRDSIFTAIRNKFQLIQGPPGD